MLPLVVSLCILGAGLLAAFTYHLTGLAQDSREMERLRRFRLGATRAILRDLSSPAHAVFAQMDRTYTRDVVCFTLDRLKQDLKILTRLGGSRRILPLFLVFRLFLLVFGWKARVRASIADARRCIGFELFLLRYIQ